MSHELPKTYDPSAIEVRWAEYWVAEKLFSVQTPEPGSPQAAKPIFTMLLPPPNVTGRLHMGHMLNQTEMDIITRWQRMRGFTSLWLPGTDHAGIATQMMVERQLASEGKSRQALGRDAFLQRVWDWKKLYGGAIQAQMKRLGASVDWDREYFTMDENLSRAVIECFVRLHEQGLIYRGKYIVNWCPRCMTAISDLEVVHEDFSGKLYSFRYPLADDPKQCVTIATTRPETMLGDTAVAVNPKDERYENLVGKKLRLPLMDREIPIIADDFADPQFGSGAVKVTPAHDPNDFAIGLRHNLPQINVMDDQARINENGGPYRGLDRYEAREKILRDLEELGLLAGVKDHTLAIGKCDRCKTIVEPRLSTQWFIKIQPLADRAIEAVEKGEIAFTPENYAKTYFEWMRNIHDWCISRQLWWGHRIPAWHCQGCSHITVARSAPAACEKCGGNKLTQDNDVLDTWFSSGLLPFTVFGWPEKTRDLDVFYPTTLLITGFDILFFWVARMIMLGCHFMADHPQGSVPFKNVYIHALVRDADRQKMSKTKGNVIDPIEVTEKYGTDAVRFTLASMASPGTDIAFSESRTDGYRAFANKIWNAARFMFMNLDRVEGASLTGGAKQEQLSKLENRWIYSRFHRVAGEVNQSLADYRFDEAANTIYKFFWGEFCDWYLEIIKPALSGAPEEARAALAFLGDLFEGSLRLLSPFMPFITEEIWHAMYEGKPPAKSIALARYPELDQRWLNDQAESDMAILQNLITDIRDIRAERKIDPKLKPPARVHADGRVKLLIEENKHIIKRLANVEEVDFVRFLSFGTPGAGWNEGSWIGPGARTKSEYAVNLDYERKVDFVAERERLSQEQRKLISELERLQSQLTNKGFLSKAPSEVIAAAQKRSTELELLIAKNRNTLLDYLGKTEAKAHHYIPQFYLEGFLDLEQKNKGQHLLWVYEVGKQPKLSPTSKAAQETHFYSFEEAGEMRATAEAVLSKLESHTAPVFRRLSEKNFILSPQERGEFAGFIALTFCRTPRFLDTIDAAAAEYEKHRARTAAQTPGELEEALEILTLLGQQSNDVDAARLREFLLSDQYTVAQESKAWTLKTMFQMVLELMPIIERMQWNWLVSDEEKFLTSDHPIALADPTSRYDYAGFRSSENAEFTFPLSPQVCLHGSWKGGGGAHGVGPATVRAINKRTIFWARKYVYASEKSLKLSALIEKILGTTLHEPLI